MSITADELTKRFARQHVTPEQGAKIAALHMSCHQLGQEMAMHAPESRELSTALSRLEESLMWAVAAIKRNNTKS